MIAKIENESSPGRRVVSTMQVKPYSTAVGSRFRRTLGAAVGAAFRRITAVLVLRRSRAAARRRLREQRHIDDRL
jgi:hypothetical protein